MQNPYDALAGQVAVIPGGAGGLGSPVVQAFVAAGVRVAIPYRTERDWEKLVKAWPAHLDRALIVGSEVDVNSQRDMHEFVQYVLDKWGRLDILLNLTGGYAAGNPVEELDDMVWDGQLDSNLRTAFVAARACLPPMIAAGHGKIIMTSSRAAVSSAANAAAYGVSKAALNKLVEALADEGRARNIQVNAIMPSIIDTPANRKAMGDADYESWPKPEQLAQVLLFLASPASDLISGAAIPVYGRA